MRQPQTRSKPSDEPIRTDPRALEIRLTEDQAHTAAAILDEIAARQAREDGRARRPATDGRPPGALAPHPNRRP